MKTQKRGSPFRTVLLALLVVTAAIASIIMIEHKKTAENEAQIRKDAQPVEVKPLMIKGNITEASWRQQEPDEVETPEPKARDDDFDWHGDSAKKKRFEASLETTMKPINGLGVFVSKTDDEDEEDD